jgi:hypothetical protein
MGNMRYPQPTKQEGLNATRTLARLQLDRGNISLDIPFYRTTYMDVGHTDEASILVHGDNHFIVRGPLPDRNAALALVRHWSLIRIGVTTPHSLDQWHIISREFRENLGWAVVVPGDGEVSLAVTRLLGEMSARGITVHNSRIGLW